MTDQSTEKDPRTLQIEERKQRMAALNKKVPRVRVTPGNDDMRRVLKHPNGTGFPKEGSVEWPHDQFTRRRINDGSVSIEEKREESHEEGQRHRRRPAEQPEPA